MGQSLLGLLGPGGRAFGSILGTGLKGNLKNLNLLLILNNQSQVSTKFFLDKINTTDLCQHMTQLKKI